MTVFELWGSLGLKTEDYQSGLIGAEKEFNEFSGGVRGGLDVISSQSAGTLSTIVTVVKSAVSTLKTVDGVITGISDTVARATVEVTKDSFNFAKSVDDNIMGVVDRAAGVVANGFSQMGSAAIGFIKDFIDEGRGFEQAMGQVSATMLKSQDDINSEIVSVNGFTGSLRDLAKELGATTKFTATEAGQALNYMALAGYDATKSAEMLPQVLNLASAGAMDLATASDMVTDAQTALGIEMSDMTKFINQMAKTASSSNTSVSQLGDALLAIGATGRRVSGGFSELQQVLGVLADNGIKASEGGNELRRILTRLTAPTDTAKESLDALGFSAYDTATGKLRPLSEMFLDLNERLSQYSDEKRDATISEIFGQYALAGSNALLSTSKERWDELAAAIEDSEGAAEKMANIQLNTLTGQVTLLTSAFSGLKTELYEKVAPELSDFVKSLADGLSRAASDVQGGNFGKAFEELGETAVTLIQQSVSYFLQNTENIKKLADGILAFVEKTGTALFQAGVDTLPTFIRLATGIATNFIQSFSDFLSDSKNISALKVTLDDFFKVINDFFTENHDSFYTIFSTLFDLAVEYIDDIFVTRRKEVYSILYEKATSILNDLSENIGTFLNDEKTQETVDNVFSFIGNVADTLLEQSPVILPQLTRFVLDIADKAVTGLADFLSDEDHINQIRTTINLILTQLQKFGDEHEEDIEKILEAVFDIALAALPKVFELRRETTIRVLATEFKKLLDGTWNDDGEDSISNSSSNLGVNIIKGIVSGFANGVQLPGILESIRAGCSSLLDIIAGEYQIHSPSQVMRDKIGKNLALGIGEGFSDGMIGVEKQIKDALPTDLNITPEIVTRGNKGFKAENYSISFNIQNVNGATQQDAENFAEMAADKLYRRVKRQKAAVI